MKNTATAERRGKLACRICGVHHAQPANGPHVNQYDQGPAECDDLRAEREAVEDEIENTAFDVRHACRFPTRPCDGVFVYTYTVTLVRLTRKLRDFAAL